MSLSTSNLDTMREQLMDWFHQEFQRRIAEAIRGRNYDYLAVLLEELVERINSLAPARKDLHQALRRAVDLELVRQELQHGAFGPAEFRTVLFALLDQIAFFQEPEDYPKTEEIRKEIANISLEQTWEEVVPPLFVKLHERINEIEDHVKAFWEAQRNVN